MKPDLSHRERVAVALAHQEPDKVPIALGVGRARTMYAAPYVQTAEILGLAPLETITSRRNAIDRFDERFLEALDIDFRGLNLRYSSRFQNFTPGARIQRDEWGIGWKEAGPYWSPVDHPLKDAAIDDLETYPWPDPDDDGYFKGLREEAEFKWKHTGYSLYATAPDHAYGITTTYHRMRGMDNYFMDLLIHKAFAHELMNRILAHHLKLYERYLEAVGDFIDVVDTGDDLGTQQGPYFSLDLWREMIKPKQKQLMDLIKNKTDAKIFYHCDGAVSSFIDDLIEIGVDILNPVQPLAKGMAPSELKAAFGTRLSFQGAIDTQQALVGSTADVEAEVKQRISQLAPEGGYILSAVHNIVPEVPGENVVHLFRCARRYGRYPIQV
jgi:uroporphyrinogen decarboxylase